MKPWSGPGGGPLVFQAGYHPRKRTFKTYPKHVFFRYENRPKIHVFACVFLNFFIISFPRFVNMTKNTPFFPILHVFAPLNDVRAYIDWSWKTTLIMWIFLRGWYPTSNTSGSPGSGSDMKCPASHEATPHWSRFLRSIFSVRVECHNVYFAPTLNKISLDNLVPCIRCWVKDHLFYMSRCCF